MTVQILRGDARHLPISDASVDLIVSSPPYWSLRAYQDNGETYDGQIGAEATPGEFVDALVECTREWMRVLKPSGSIWVNLGDKYAGAPSGPRQGMPDGATRKAEAHIFRERHKKDAGVPTKSLIGIPWRYAIRCIDELGFILRAEVIWSKPNGLPESVTDRVRRSHEQWFHMTLNPRYYSAVDEVREEHAGEFLATGVRNPRYGRAGGQMPGSRAGEPDLRHERLGSQGNHFTAPLNPLGKLPGSVWTIATEPLRVPDHLGIDHFAAFPTEWPRRIITGWSPRGVCVECGAGRRPVAEVEHTATRRDRSASWIVGSAHHRTGETTQGDERKIGARYSITGEACDCPEPTAPTTPGVVLDPFGGTGTTALVADALGRHGISVDMSADYCRLAEWRTTDPKQRAKAARREFTPHTEQVDGQAELFGRNG